MDDSGSDQHNNVVIFGAVMIPDDRFRLVDATSGHVIERLFPGREDAFNEFHARALFLGEKDFEGINEPERDQAIGLLLDTLREHELPYVYGAIDKSRLGRSPWASADARDVAFHVCVLGIDAWIKKRHSARYADDGTVIIDGLDLAMLILDDVSEEQLKSRLRKTFRTLRARHVGGRSEPSLTYRFHDGMFFSDSRDSVGIQISDLCGYFLSRHLRGDEDSRATKFIQTVTAHAVCLPDDQRAQFGGIVIHH
jgi:hypothetical protein